MAIAAAGVRLPHFDERVGYRPRPFSSRTWPWTMVCSPIGVAGFGIVKDQIMVERTKLLTA